MADKYLKDYRPEGTKKESSVPFGTAQEWLCDEKNHEWPVFKCLGG